MSNPSPENVAITDHARSREPIKPVEWDKLVTGIKAGEEASMSALYDIFNRGIRYYLCRQLGPQALEDKVHDNFLIVVNAIRRGDLREPERLMGYIKTVTHRQVAGEITDRIRARRNSQLDVGHEKIKANGRYNPEMEAILQQKDQMTQEVLEQLSPKKRDILTRFYIEEQPKDQIIEEMGLRGKGESAE